MARSCRTETRAKMNGSIAFVICCVVGNALGYNVQRESPYNTGPNDPYDVGYNQNYLQEPSQRLFWNKGQGTNQVGGTGLWATLTNKFPFLGTMFGRMELPTQYYGVPNEYDVSTQYGAPGRQQPQRYQTTQFYQQPGQFGQGSAQFYQQPGQFDQGSRQFYQQPGQLGQGSPQFYQQPGQLEQGSPQFYQQPGQFGQRFAPSGRDVALTDDAVIVTPPFVPAAPAAPAPAPVPVPVPAPTPEPFPGYEYNKPQYRLELPHK